MSTDTLCCHDCGLPYQDFGLDATVSDTIWRQIAPQEDGEGILCASCMVARIARLPGAMVVRMQVEFAEDGE